MYLRDQVLNIDILGAGGSHSVQALILVIQEI
jgi:hypothetical protein